jgi:hypothetical protein
MRSHFRLFSLTVAATGLALSGLTLVIPEGALVVKAALLEEEHDFWGSSAYLDLIAAALHRQGSVKAGGAAEGKP